MQAALVLVDLQRDFLDRPGLEPAEPALLPTTSRLIEACRARRIPVVHVHTVTRPDGADRMPHWVRQGTVACVAGTGGVLPPPAVAPLPGEPVFAKRFFSGFGNPALAAHLAGLGTRLLIIAGIYLHGCVRSTVMDGYERGFEVWVAADAVGSNEPGHAEHTRRYLEGRAATFLPVAGILARLDQAGPVPATG
ncbi:MAG: cysteine hydrolase [Gammaproteobacteria bacterium]|nr:cysteine hydrolase [Gammaproteobacteria bacterium]